MGARSACAHAVHPAAPEASPRRAVAAGPQRADQAPARRCVETALRCAVKTAPDFGGGFERSKKCLPGPPPPGVTPPRRSLGGSVIQNCAQRQRYSERPRRTLCAVLKPVPRRALTVDACLRLPQRSQRHPIELAQPPAEARGEALERALARALTTAPTLHRGALGEHPGERASERAEQRATGHPGTAVDGPTQPPCTQAVNRAPQGASRTH